MLMAFAASGLPAQNHEAVVRERLFASDFPGARVALVLMPAGSARDDLGLLIDECELTEICDTAGSLLEAGDGQGATALLVPALKRLNGKHAAAPRGRALLVIAQALPAKTGAEQAKLAASLKQLEQAVAAGAANETKRQEAITSAKTAAQESVSRARDALAAGSEAARKGQVSVAADAFSRAENALLRAFTQLATARRVMDPLDYDGERRRLEQQVEPVYEQVMTGLANVHYFQKNITEALRVVDRALHQMPMSRALLDMRVKAEEWRRYAPKDD